MIKEIDGYRHFLFLLENGCPAHNATYKTLLIRMIKKYNKTHDVPLPHITPHTLRHTFCTRLAQKNMKVLIVDADPQSDVSAGFGYRDCDESNETLTALMDTVMKDEDIPSDCYIRHQAEGIDIILQIIVLIIRWYPLCGFQNLFLSFRYSLGEYPFNL